jgi:hypothetical protein
MRGKAYFPGPSAGAAGLFADEMRFIVMKIRRTILRHP